MQSVEVVKASGTSLLLQLKELIDARLADGHYVQQIMLDRQIGGLVLFDDLDSITSSPISNGHDPDGDNEDRFSFIRENGSELVFEGVVDEITKQALASTE